MKGEMGAWRRADSRLDWHSPGTAGRHGRDPASISSRGAGYVPGCGQGADKVLTGSPYSRPASGRVPTHDSGSPSFHLEPTGSCPVGHTASLKPKAVPLSAQPELQCLPAPFPSIPSEHLHTLTRIRVHIHIASIRAQRRPARFSPVDLALLQYRHLLSIHILPSLLQSLSKNALPCFLNPQETNKPTCNPTCRKNTNKESEQAVLGILTIHRRPTQDFPSLCCCFSASREKPVSPQQTVVPQGLLPAGVSHL